MKIVAIHISLYRFDHSDSVCATGGAPWRPGEGQNHARIDQELQGGRQGH